MKLKYIALLPFILITAAFAAAQEIPSLPADPAITTGALPNGVRYYITENRTVKGMLDLALVRKPGKSDEDSLTLGHSESIAAGDLELLPRFISRSPMKMLSDYGVRYGRGGYLSVTDDAVIYRFNSLSTSRGPAALDSLLLMVFGMIEGENHLRDSLFDECYSTEGHAVVISGDIDKEAVLKKLHMLSLMVPEKESGRENRPYVWQPVDTSRCSVRVNPSMDGAFLMVSYRSPRTPEELMSSVLPTVSKQLGNELGIILKKRILKEMRRGGIPLANIYYDYRQSTGKSGDEQYVIAVHTDKEHLLPAVSVIGSVLADIDMNGAGLKEYVEAQDEQILRARTVALRPVVPNREYIERCIASFVYGSSLADGAEEVNFFRSGAMADTTRLRLFNNFAAQLIDSTKNLSVSYMADTLVAPCSEILECFRKPWKDGSSEGYVRSYAANRNDVLSLSSPGLKCKVSPARQEPVSGGKLWVFENGMKVIYKKMPTDGILYYDFMIRGGASAMRNIRRGEGAFLSDMLELYSIAGLKTEDFQSLLGSHGISMRSRVGISELEIYGSSPSSDLPLLMNALASVANERTIDKEAFDYYSSSMKIYLKTNREAYRERKTKIDDIMYPDYNYSSDKEIRNIYPDLPEKAFEFFESQFSKANDGVFVIIGDMMEDELRKELQLHMSKFRTKDRARTMIYVPYKPTTGWSTYTYPGDRSSVDVAMSSLLQMSAGNMFAAKVAAKAIEDAAQEALCGTGMYLRFETSFAIYPQERFNVMVSADEANLRGLGAGTEYENALKVLVRLRNAVSGLASGLISEEKLAMYKQMVLDEEMSSRAEPEYWLNAVSTRYSIGKDFVTKADERIAEVTAGKVHDIISSLYAGSKVEYVIDRNLTKEN